LQTPNRWPTLQSPIDWQIDYGVSSRCMETEILSERTSPIANPILSISVRAGEVFANRRKALRWLQSPNPALGGLSPLDAARTEEGCQEVEDILGRIEHGIIG